MKDDDLLEEIVYLNITTNKYLIEVSAQYFRDSLSSLAYQGGRRLSTGFEALTTGCLADYWKVRGRDKSLFLEFMASNV